MFVGVGGVGLHAVKEMTKRTLGNTLKKHSADLRRGYRDSSIKNFSRKRQVGWGLAYVAAAGTFALDWDQYLCQKLEDSVNEYLANNG